MKIIGIALIKVDREKDARARKEERGPEDGPVVKSTCLLLKRT